ncbi:MAG TPA: nuclear transport factor 2 family protein [Opitutus sp.]|nr:nuclear transport factor 2 family protein [Opitutus sp.]
MLGSTATHPNLGVIRKFFEASSHGDRDGLRATLAENAKWIFPGRHRFSGTKNGLNEIAAFFGELRRLGFRFEQLVAEATDRYVIDCERAWTDKYRVELQWCVLWKIENGKIVQGAHFAADQRKTDRFFNTVRA